MVPETTIALPIPTVEKKKGPEVQGRNAIGREKRKPNFSRPLKKWGC